LQVAAATLSNAKSNISSRFAQLATCKSGQEQRNIHHRQEQQEQEQEQEQK